MKTKKLSVIILIAALAFTACSEDNEVITSHDEVNIVASISSNTTGTQLRASFNSDGSGEFAGSDEYRLYFWSPSRGLGGGYVYRADGTNPLYWDEISLDNKPVEFLAWYPNYNFSGSMVQGYKIANAATEAAKDLLLAPAVTVNKGNTVNLQFKHVMHKLIINLTSNYYSTANLDNAQVSLKNLKSDIDVDFLNGAIDESSASGTDAYPSLTGSSTQFIVAPQALTEGVEIIKITIGGKNFAYKVPATLTKLESGKVLTLNLLIQRNQLAFQTGSISAWGTQDEINSTLEYIINPPN